MKNDAKLYTWVKSSLCVVLLGLVFLSAGWIQSSLFLNTDVSWLLEASKRMLLGGNYTNDFFENNPPWILYFYSPAVMCANLLSISLIISVRAYVFLLSAISLGLSYLLLKKILSKSNDNLILLLLLGQAFVYLILPMADFGQRENLFFILIMPYFFMMAARIDGLRISPLLAFIIGLLAGSGLMIKPYFLMTLFLVEGYYFIAGPKPVFARAAKKRLRSKLLYCLIRPELFSIVLLLVTYLALLFTRHTDYLTQVMPFALRWCYLGTRRPWGVVIGNMLTLSCFFPFFFYMATRKINPYIHLTHVLLFGLLGFLCSYLIQQEDWYYHILPAISGSMLINLLLLSVYFNKNTLNLISTTLLSIYLFCVPISNTLYLYDVFKLRKNHYEPLISFINEHAPHQSIYFFTTNIAHTFPVISNSENTTSSSRFSFFWALPGLIKQSYLPMDKGLQTQLQNDKNFLIDMVADDLRVKKPALVFIDSLVHKNSLNFGMLTNISFNYLNYFKENANFRAEWRHYRYLTTISDSISVPINPKTYNIKLTYQQIPLDKDIKTGTLYVYTRHNSLVEIAINNDFGEVLRIKMHEDPKRLEQPPLFAMQHTLMTPGAVLSTETKEAFFAWLTQQVIVYPFYRFKVYTHST